MNKISEQGKHASQQKQDAKTRQEQWAQSAQSSVNSTTTRKIKQKSLNMWTCEDVLKWLRKHIGEGYYIAYKDMFVQHHVTGQTLIRMNENVLIRMGIDSHLHRNEILTKVAVLRLKSDLVELKSLHP